jgi:glutaconate CoA-transferase subunit B
MSARGCSTLELMACELAGRLRDGEIVIIGGASPVPMAAALLAQLTTAPNLTLLTGSGAVNPRPSHLAPSGGDHAYVAGAEAYFTMEDTFDDTERGRWDVGIFGGIQVDPYGNFNLTFVGGELGAPKFRGPGLVNVGLPLALGRTMLCVERHDPAVFVERPSFVSGAGRRRPDGTPYPAGRLGTGPDVCVTSLATLDFAGEGERMAIATVHPGVDAEHVRAQTGFALGGPERPPATPAPDPAVLEVLRRRVDTTGVLRAEQGAR